MARCDVVYLDGFFLCCVPSFLQRLKTLIYAPLSKYLVISRHFLLCALSTHSSSFNSPIHLTLSHLPSRDTLWERMYIPYGILQFIYDHDFNRSFSL